MLKGDEKFDFFISHSGAETEEAILLYDMLKKINREWNIFIDRENLSDNPEWLGPMLTAVRNSKHLIFLAKTPEVLEKSWVFDEVQEFYTNSASRFSDGRADFCISYFGIIYNWNIKTELTGDAKRAGLYHSMYKIPNNIILGENQSVADMERSIRIRALDMISSGTDATPEYFLDKAVHYAKQKLKVDEKFTPEAIDDELIPTLSRGKNRYSLERIIDILSEGEGDEIVEEEGRQEHKNDIIILGEEGGSGKTTVMTKLFYHFLNKALEDNNTSLQVPVYVEASALAGSNNPIKRYLAKYFFGENTAIYCDSTEASNYMSEIDKAFRAKKEKPQYILLIDGYNEIAPDVIEKVEKELDELFDNGGVKNVRIVISGRTVSDEIKKDRFDTYYLNRISDYKIFNFLKKRGNNATVSKGLKDVLSKPMYLTMFAETDSENKITTRSDLLESFIKIQQDKENKGELDKKTRAFYKFSREMLLPFIAYRLCTDETGNNFVLTSDKLRDIRDEALDYWESREFERICTDEQDEILDVSEALDMSGRKLLHSALEYYTKIFKLLREEEEDKSDGDEDEKRKSYMFIHQVYRDFFAALYICEDIKNCAKDRGKLPCKSLETDIKEKDILFLVSELLKEKRPFFSKEENRWDYSCNENSYLIRLIENSRENGQNNNPVFVKMVIELLKRARGMDLSGIDLSALDLTGTNLTSLVLVRFDDFCSYPTSFKASKLNASNILTSNPANFIMAACTNEKNIALFESGTKFKGGVLKIWKKGPFDNNPIKTVTDISYKLHKIIFSKDNEKIYGMAGHTVVEIDVSLNEKFGKGEKVLFAGRHKLANIFLDDEGRLFYTTVLNSFNPQPVLKDEISENPVEISFFGINSAACVRKDKKQLVFGHVAGREGFKVFNLNEETNEWEEQKIGIPLLIEEYISEIEKELKGFRLYERFFSDKENEPKTRAYNRNVNKNFRCMYFRRLIYRHGNDHSDYYNIPFMIYKSVRAEMRARGLKLFGKLKESLHGIFKKYEQIFTDYEKENRILAYLNGRKITSIEYKKDNDTVFVTYYNNYDKKKNNSKKESKCHATVAEIRLSDLSSRLIHIYNGKSIPHSAYCGEDAVIYCNEKVWIADKMERFSCIPVIFMMEPILFQSEKLPASYMRMGRYIYEMNEEFIPVKSFFIPFKGEDGFALILSEDNIPYFASFEPAKNIEEAGEITLQALNAKNGNVETVTLKGEIISGNNRLDDYHGKKLTGQVGMINVYKNGILHYCFETERNLCLTGCDFTSVTGDITIPENLDVLTRYGALTDGEKVFATPVLRELDFDFTPSERPFLEPDEVKDTVSNYIFSEGEEYVSTLKDEDEDEDDPKKWKERAGYDGEVWDKVHFASYSRRGFEASDFSILEHLYYYKFLTHEMVYFFMQAGLIEKPVIYNFGMEGVKNRMKNILCRNLQLLERFDCEGGSKPLIYTYSNRYGKELLSMIDGMANLENRTRKDLNKNIGKCLVLNLWFSYTLMKYKELVTGYDAEVKFESKYTYLNQSYDTIIRRMIILKDTPLFLRLVRGELTEEKIEKNKQRIYEFCQIASNYPYVANHRIHDGLKKSPVIVIIGESYEYCQKLNEALKDVEPHIRKIYTYDNLLSYGIKNDCEDIYIEFKDGEPFVLGLNELI